jgi:hypothetical protein
MATIGKLKNHGFGNSNKRLFAGISPVVVERYPGNYRKEQGFNR